MGGLPKGRLYARDSGEPLLVRTARLLRSLAVTPVLVGNAQAYRDLLPELTRLPDVPEDVGPLGGLGALLAAAQGELALACDMPFLSASLLEQLIHAPVSGDVLSPRGVAGFWEPFCARYRIAGVASALAQVLADQERSFRALFARVSVVELLLNQSQRGWLRDWDTQEDVKEDMQ